MRTTGNTFKRKVERLCGEVADDIDHIATPEGEEPLLLVNTGEAVHHSLIPLVYRDSLVSILHTDMLYSVQGLPIFSPESGAASSLSPKGQPQSCSLQQRHHRQ